MPWLLLDSEDVFVPFSVGRSLDGDVFLNDHDHDIIPVNGGVTPVEDACEKPLAIHVSA